MGKQQKRRTVSYRPEVYQRLDELAEAKGIPLTRMLDHMACAELERNGVHVEPYQGHPSPMPRLRKPVARRPEPKPASEAFPGLDGVRVLRTSGCAVQDHGAYVEL